MTVQVGDFAGGAATGLRIVVDYYFRAMQQNATFNAAGPGLTGTMGNLTIDNNYEALANDISIDAFKSSPGKSYFIQI